MNKTLLTAAVLVGAVSLSGCDRLGAAWTAFNAPKAQAPAATPGEPAAPAPAGSTAALTASGHGLPVKALPDANLQSYASVVEVHDLAQATSMDGKIFGVAGGDPAMNGEQTYIAFYRNPAEGWWVYQIGDFLSFKVLNQSAGRVDLEVEESTMDEATGTIGKRTRRMIVGFTVAPHEEQPVMLEITPAT
ncbi:hypothetical protein [Brevundimonas goettingensis]|uniref:Lipoprotein n=1 Tax=Brevundimonas goettingensis TaxID=2774190 RepID=A0A975C284_9CAUL|nr:hypothetical protein [Brevundimonas goettingensis]QTC92506.1 hypothetical protein IFJ75_06450 [Brevundimonas goettingensis]